MPTWTTSGSSRRGGRCSTVGLGRPSVPVDTLLQLLFSKHRCGLGYKSLCRDVSDSISWRRFCRIGLDRPVPHPTTLVKLARRAGPTTVEQLNSVLLGKLGEDKLLGPHAAGGHHRGGGRHRLADRRRPAGARGSEGRTMARSMRRVITSAWGVSP
jgi:IS5 family transposase